MESKSTRISAVFFGQTDFTKYIWNFFGPPFMVLRSVLPVVLALIFGWNSRLHRRYLLITVLCTVIILIFTLTYIYPINNVLVFKAGGDLSPQAIQSMVNHWIIGDRLRFVVYLISYFFLLKALDFLIWLRAYLNEEVGTGQSLKVKTGTGGVDSITH